MAEEDDGGGGVRPRPQSARGGHWSQRAGEGKVEVCRMPPTPPTPQGGRRHHFVALSCEMNGAGTACLSVRVLRAVPGDTKGH